MSPKRSFSLPKRKGKKPDTGSETPQLQYTQISPAEIYESMVTWMFATLPSKLPKIHEQDTSISIETTRALWLRDSVRAADEKSFMPPPGSREFAHLHADGSLHVAVSDEITREVIKNAWGLPHPWKAKGVNETLVYAPRNTQEMKIAQQMVLAAYTYVTGEKPDVKI